jgi:GAF domain-containing protein
VLLGDLTTDRRLDAMTRAVYTQTGIRASALLPLSLAGQWVGLIAINWSEPHTFTEAEARLYRSLANQAAVVVNNRLLFEQTRQRADREALINAIGQKIQSTVTVQSALETAIQELGLALKARRTGIALGPDKAEAVADEPNGKHV